MVECCSTEGSGVTTEEIIMCEKRYCNLKLEADKFSMITSHLWSFRAQILH